MRAPTSKAAARACGFLALAVAASCTTDNLTAPESTAGQPRFVLNAVGDPVTFCNPTVINIPDGGRTNPYPSAITVDGIAPGSWRVTATIKNFTHPFPTEIDMVLVGPGGEDVMLMSDANAIVNQFLDATLVFDDDAAAFVPGGFPSLPSGTYKPTDYEVANDPDLPPGGGVPLGPYGSSLAVFSGAQLNGTWALYVWRDEDLDNSKPINGGWCVSFTPVSPEPTANAAGPYLGTALVPLTLNGSGSLDPDADIQSYAWDFGDGQTGTGPTPTHTYGNAGTYTVTLTVTDAGGRTDDATATVTMFPPGSYCNPASILIRDVNTAVPYPSTITVTGAGSGPFKVTATLKGLTHATAMDLDVLLAGPGGQTVMLMSDAAGSGDLVNTTLTFDDGASAQLPLSQSGGIVPSGSYKPTNVGSPDNMVLAPAEPYASSLGVFTGTNPNGTWRLFLRDDTFLGNGFNVSFSGGWCVNIVPTNAAPVANAGGPYTGVEGSAITFDATASTDPDNNIETYTWDFGDGNTGNGATVQHTYANGGTYTVTLVVTDADDASNTAIATATIADVAPTATFNAPAVVAEGGVATISLASPSAADARYAFDCGGGYGAIGSASSAACPAADNGTLPVRAKVVDASIDELFTEYTASIDITNLAPTAVFTNDGPVSEGTAFQLSLSNASDVAADLAAGLTFQFDCGSGYGATASCPTTDNGEVHVRGKVIDKDGGSSEYTAIVTVTNVAPVVASIVLPANPVAANTPVTLGATFTDPASADTHTGSFQLDAGGPVIPASVESGSLSASVSFAQAGVYTIIARVTDDDGGVGTRSSENDLPAFVVVYDPTGGFVTGGGWISSPAGAYAAEPSFTGKASFGFVAKYQPGANKPSGNTEFQFKAGNLSFKSTSYDWLVVAASQAKYKGEGTINGGGSYGFMVTALDGDSRGSGGTDGFRIKIWDLATGAIAYDNKPGEGDESDATTSLGGGSIVIHR